jgi:hypothetical protein
MRRLIAAFCQSPAHRRGLADARRFADELQHYIDITCGQRLAKLAKHVLSVADDWDYQAQRDLAFLNQAASFRSALRRARDMPSSDPSEARAEVGALRFCISTAFLRHECYPYLTGDEQRREVLHLVTGPITPDGVRVPSRIEKVIMQEQSPAYAGADPLATHRQLVALERDGHALLAVFHSHISHGQDSTRPSQTDITTQDRLASIGWDAIGGIFNLDGWVRLFSTAHDFTVELYGNGAETVSAAPRETIIKLAIEP